MIKYPRFYVFQNYWDGMWELRDSNGETYRVIGKFDTREEAHQAQFETEEVCSSS